MIKVIVISDIRIYCEGLSQILADTQAIEVTSADNNFQSALDKIVVEFPDVILLDMTMVGSCRFAKKILRNYPDIKIVALAVPEDENNIKECAEAGIVSYAAREASLNDLIDTVIATKAGEFYCPPKIAACIFKIFQRIASNTKNQCLTSTVITHDKLATVLTKREQQIYALIVKGLSNKQISQKLIIEVSTVKNHVHNILVKLDVKSRLLAVTLIQRNPSSNKSDQELLPPSYS